MFKQKNKKMRNIYLKQPKIKQFFIKFFANTVIFIVLILSFLLALEFCLRSFPSATSSMTFENFVIPLFIRGMYAITIVYLSSLRFYCARYMRTAENNSYYWKIKKYFFYSLISFLLLITFLMIFVFVINSFQ